MRRAALLAAAGVAAAAAAAGIAFAATDDDELSGAERRRVVDAAVDYAGRGVVLEAERGDDGAAYEVELRLPGGGEVEVALDDELRIHDSTPRQELPTGGAPVDLGARRFRPRIDHPYWPMAPGSRWIYRERSDGSEQRVVVTVTRRRKTILGVSATVVHDVVTEDGQLVEETFDWYAQDDEGNVWYLGEDTKEFEGGEVVSTAGSWEAGVDGAQAGILLPARPVPGLAYRQEYLAGEAEDAATVLSLDEKVSVPFGSFDGVLMTKDFTPLEPGLLEHKFYVRGVGPVLALTIAGGAGREELVRFEGGR